MKKMLFIRPSVTNEDLSKVKYSSNYYIIPLGILSIIAYCNKKLDDVDFKILDFGTLNYKNISNKEMYKKIENEIRDFSPDLVGISILSSSTMNHANEIGKIAKNISGSICTILGGLAASVLTKKEISNDFNYIDAVCYSEGEIPLYELLSSEDIFKEIEENDSFTTHKKAIDNVFFPKPNVLTDLDEIPFLPLSMLNLNEYENTVLQVEGKNSIVMHTVRGCPFSCRFCAAPGISGKKLRYYSAKRVVEDLKKYKSIYDFNQLVLLDEQILMKKNRMIEMLEAISQLDMTLSIPNGMNIALVDEEVANYFNKVKMDRYVFALESGSQRVLDELMNKPVNLKEASKTLKLMYTQKWETHSNFVIGMPGETEEDRNQTIDFIKNNYIDWSVFFTALPIRGSKLYEDVHSNNNIITDCNGLERIKTHDIDPVLMDERAYLYNLDCNFVNNLAMRLGDYEKAYKRFNFIKNKYPNHAFAWYYLSKCCKELDKLVEEEACLKKYFEIIKTDSQWEKYAKHFNLPVKEAKNNETI